jgi:glutaredoxin-like YruB-family protein
LGLIVAVPALISAEVWRYADSDGIAHFVDSIEKIPDKFRAQSSKIQRGSVSKAGKAVYDGVTTASKTGVEIYVTSWCGYCRALEDYLEKKQIAFKRYDIEKDAAANSRYKQLGRPGVPISVINGEVISGFNRRAIDRAIKGAVEKWS